MVGPLLLLELAAVPVAVLVIGFVGFYVRTGR